MSSKQLQSILKNIPSATAQGEIKNTQDQDINAISRETSFSMNFESKRREEPTERIVAEVPSSIKKQIKNYIEANKGMTEKTVLLKALKSFGFKIDDIHLVDKRTTRK